LDKKTHRPVRGLTIHDFSILEDNKAQTVAAFAAVDVPDPPALPMVAGQKVTWTRDVAPDVQSNTSGAAAEGRLFVMVIDDAMIPNTPFVVQQTKKAARAVVDRLSPADRMAVVLTAESRHAQDFTTSRASLLAAIERVRPGYATYFFGWNNYARPISGAFRPPVQNDDDIGPREWSFGTLVQVADALIASPERRKVLVYITPGIPINGTAAGAKLADGSGLAAHEANKRLVGELPELFRRMQRANVSAWPIDSTGTAGIGPIVTAALNSLGIVNGASVDQTTGQLGGGGPPPPAGGRSGSPASHGSPPPGSGTPDATDFGHYAARLDLDFLLAAAANTGGRALVNTDDLTPGHRADLQ
jgi:VWFA-related protein